MEVVTSADETINPPTSHLAEAGGKRLRPVLALLTAQLGDPALATGEQIRDAGVAVELTHIATLYHDDVMDEAPLRRAPRALRSSGATPPPSSPETSSWPAPPSWWRRSARRP